MSTTLPPIDHQPPEALSSDLCWLITRTSHLLTTQFSAALEASGISPRQHAVLIAALDAEHKQTDLARIVGLDKTTLMVTLDELEKAGLVERRPMPTDRRARVIAVTPEGERSLRDADVVLQRSRDEVLAVLPVDERETFLRSLARLACPGDGAPCTGSAL